MFHSFPRWSICPKERWVVGFSTSPAVWAQVKHIVLPGSGWPTWSIICKGQWTGRYKDVGVRDLRRLSESLSSYDFQVNWLCGSKAEVFDGYVEISWEDSIGHKDAWEWRKPWREKGLGKAAPTLRSTVEVSVGRRNECKHTSHRYTRNDCWFPSYHKFSMWIYFRPIKWKKSSSQWSHQFSYVYLTVCIVCLRRIQGNFIFLLVMRYSSSCQCF